MSLITLAEKIHTHMQTCTWGHRGVGERDKRGEEKREGERHGEIGNIDCAN